MENYIIALIVIGFALIPIVQGYYEKISEPDSEGLNLADHRKLKAMENAAIENELRRRHDEINRDARQNALNNSGFNRNEEAAHLAAKRTKE